MGEPYGGIRPHPEHGGAGLIAGDSNKNSLSHCQIAAAQLEQQQNNLQYDSANIALVVVWAHSGFGSTLQSQT